MGARGEWFGQVIAVTPAGCPDAVLTASASRSGALGVLDLGLGDRAALAQLALAVELSGPAPIGLRVTAACQASLAAVAAVLAKAGEPAGPAVVVLAGDAPWSIGAVAERWPVLAEVTSVATARAARAAGAYGLIARGAESGGQVSELGAFVLLQQLLADDASSASTVPVWVCGGIGPDTAAAAVVGGAAGVVLDTQLALLPEATLPEADRALIAAADGTNTSLVNGNRSQPRPDGTALPIGQDSFLATDFAHRHATTARAIHAVSTAITAALEPDGDVSPAVAPGSALARAMGTALPIAQGPMTRVSDQAGFARVVADAGALPFLALAIASGEQTRDLLARTTAELGERPWGVGVLGFAPEEVRAAQLDAIREFRPAAALIAGGRPDQAAALEEVGIATFLHVPSPALLRQFLAAGARRFVFEGAECGGHVGPRSSFCLWQAVIDVLRDFVDDGGIATELHILFAGGIHDARSAAMVAAAAAPLTRRGAAVGVLMGTAYLFTAEAVAHGAVRPVFQREAVNAETTVLLETAPGHVTRCLPSPFTDQFDTLRRDLLADGTPEREVWQRLEDLNVGRLRIASKGLRREGADLVEVDDAGQLADGLFMAGQVAVLRAGTTDLASLHHEVTTGAVEFLAARTTPRPRPETEKSGPLDVAIVGMSAMFPAAEDLPTFWANILANTDTITEVPPERWDPSVYFTADSTPSTGDRTYSKWGGFLPRIPFDALRHGIPPTALASIEPVQLLALEAAQRALRDAGYERRPFARERTSVIFGAEAGSDLAGAATLRMMLRGYLADADLPSELDEQLPRLTEDSFPGRLVNVIAGRIANRLDLGGANYTVDAACGSSLAALDAACKELLAGGSDVVLCGGADLHNSIEDFLMFASVGALSPRGRCRPFDADGDGIALGEGVACVVLKRLADAERDGDRVYAVIRGIGSGSDGRALGLTAPRAEGQRRALDRAYRNADVTPARIGLVEAHGTGTVVGDRTELAALTELFTDHGAEPGSCALGSVKSQIGHTKCAAGMAGLIKAALAVHTGVLPPTRISTPNPAWTPEKSPFVFRTEPALWPRPAAERLAGVSAFGFGGTNFHLVLAGHPSADLNRHARTSWPAELFLVRGVDPDAAGRALRRLRTLLATNDTHGRPWALRDFAATVSAWGARDTNPVRFAFVVADLDELIRLVDAVLAGERPDQVFVGRDEAEGQVAVLFPGQGSQRPGMLAELFTVFADLNRISRLGGAEVAAMFPPAAFDPEQTRAQRDRLRDTRMAQPALGIAGLAAHELLVRSGVRADMFAGHSYGELVALTAAGALDPKTLLALSGARAEAIFAAAGDDPGAMAAVSASGADVERMLGEIDGVVIANQNAPDQTVIAGPSAAVEAAVVALRDDGLSVSPLPVACAFHSPVVSGAGATFGAVLAGVEIGDPDRPVWTNRTAQTYAPGAVRAELAAQLGAPVRFADEIEAMYAAGARIFVEAGPGGVLTGLVGQILGDRPHTAIPLGRGGLPGFLTGLAKLAAAGVDVRTGWLHASRPGQDLTFATPPARPRWTVDGHLVRTADGAIIPHGLAPARPVAIATDSRTDPMSNPAGPSGPLGREALVAEFLRAGREMVNAQRDVLLGYLTDTTVAVPTIPLTPIATAQPVVPPAPAEPAAPAVPVPVVEELDPLGTVIRMIAARTGYPEDMIDPDLDLEADLSVDSIKRTEIAGELSSTVANGGGLVEDLVRSRTAGAMAKVLGGVATAPSVPAPATAAEPAAPETVAGEVVVGDPPRRFVLAPADADAEADPSALVGARLLLVGGESRVSEELSGRLRAAGALPTFDAADDVDGLVLLHALTPSAEPVLPGIFPMVQAMLPKLRWCVAVAGAGTQSAGLRGFFRSLHREYPQVRARLLEVDGNRPADVLAELVVGELPSRDEEPVVLLGPRRQVPRLASTPLGTLATTGAGPAGEGAAELAAAGIRADSSVLLVGGARGITARVATALAAATRCRIELAGRTELSVAAEPAELAGKTDLPGLRAALTALGHRDPREIDRTAREILARREVAATLAELHGHGSLANYHPLDVTDPDAVRTLVKQLSAECGRLDCVVFAAGVISDRLIAEKDPDSFTRVFRTKVEGARALLDALEDLPERPRSVVLFGSIAAVLGNRGQADYAAANDALETLGATWSRRTGVRALTVHWGPWAPRAAHGGMVTEELARSYRERGIGVLAPDEAVAGLFRELAWGGHDEPAVLLTASVW